MSRGAADMSEQQLMPASQKERTSCAKHILRPEVALAYFPFFVQQTFRVTFRVTFIIKTMKYNNRRLLWLILAKKLKRLNFNSRADRRNS